MNTGFKLRLRMRKKQHKQFGTPSYRSWASMIQRCTNPNHACHSYYGGRGISVCERWRDFRHFLSDMGERPPGLTLDRIDNAKGYEPGNCRWATQKQQMRNTHRARTVVINGEKVAAAALSERTGIAIATIKYRMNAGWAPEDLVKPPQ